MKQRNWLDLVRPEAIGITTDATKTTVTLEPMERGFGFTLGSALRRVLLSALPGAAVTAARLDGAFRDRSQGEAEAAAEDVVLYLKQLSFRTGEEFRSAQLRLAIDKPRLLENTAGAGPVEILAHPQPICSPTSQTAIDVFVATGSGYVPAGAHPPAHVPDGFTAIDALHSPVRRVSYNVEPARLGHVLDYDRLTMTIETNGTISGEEALTRAARILHDQFGLFVNFEEEPRPMVVAEPDPLGFNPILLQRIDELEFSVRASNCMRAENITYLGDLVTRTEAQMLRVPNFGRKSLNDIKSALAAEGLHLGMIVPEWPPADTRLLAQRHSE